MTDSKNTPTPICQNHLKIILLIYLRRIVVFCKIFWTHCWVVDSTKKINFETLFTYSGFDTHFHVYEIKKYDEKELNISSCYLKHLSDLLLLYVDYLTMVNYVLH